MFEEILEKIICTDAVVLDRKGAKVRKGNSLPCNISMQIRFPNPLSSQTKNLTTSMSANKNQGGNSQSFNDENNAFNMLIT